MTDYMKEINKFKIANGFDASDDKMLAILHLMNTHSLDWAQAVAQTALDNDHGMDAYHYANLSHKLTIYKSRLTKYPMHAVQGLIALRTSFEWLENTMSNDHDAGFPIDNPCIYNLIRLIKEDKKKIRRIHFELVTPFPKEDLENLPAVDDFESYLGKSRLNKKSDIQISFGFEKYNLEPVVAKVKNYSLEKYGFSRVKLNKETYLDLTLTPLHNLVELYRQRGDMLFDKNVRLSLKNHKKAKDKLVAPMETALHKICNAKLPSEMFTFYHGGVTLAVASLDGSSTLMKLESPSVINGCQTITIANEFLKKIEREQDQVKLNRFKEIKVVTKIVVGALEEYLREITNANNRHNSIDNWQLYSNSPIHVEIELSLKGVGVFYERQEGKFEASKDKPSFQQEYFNTNKANISVQTLGQLIALSKRNLNWAAKKSEIFSKSENHDKIFDKTIPKCVYDMIFIHNLYKALDRAMEKYLQKPAYADRVSGIFKRPMVQVHIFYLGCLFYYQKNNKGNIRRDFHDKLFKKAHPDLVNDVEKSYLFRVMSRIKDWYITEYGMPSDTDTKLTDVNLIKLKEYIDILATDLEINPEGHIPFVSSIDWSPYSNSIDELEIDELLKV
jgi:hypothetical protein